MGSLLSDAENSFNKISKTRWQYHCKHVKKLQSKYYAKNGLLKLCVNIFKCHNWTQKKMTPSLIVKQTFQQKMKLKLYIGKF